MCSTRIFFSFQMKFVFILVPWGTWVCAHHCKGEHQNFGLCTLVQLCCVAQQLFPWWQSRAHKDSLYNHPVCRSCIVDDCTIIYSLRVNPVCFLKSTSLTGYNLEGAESFICLGFCLFDYDRVEMRNIFLTWSCYSAAWRKPHPLIQF